VTSGEVEEKQKAERAKAEKGANRMSQSGS
jgi:hypothetical protein